MNENYIRKLIQLVEESEIDSLEVSRWGRKIKITRKGYANGNGNGHGDHHPVMQTLMAAPVPVSAVSHAQSVSVAPQGPSATPATEDTGKLVEIKSPMVGTFYSAPSPDAQPYVTLNEKIMAGQVVCIVEAMKLMNEIESEVSGRVAKVCVENGQPVEFGQVIFLIDPTA